MSETPRRTAPRRRWCPSASRAETAENSGQVNPSLPLPPLRSFADYRLGRLSRIDETDQKVRSLGKTRQLPRRTSLQPR